MNVQGYEIVASLVAFVGFGGLVAIASWIWRLSERLTLLEADAVAANRQADTALNLGVETRNHLSAFEVEAARRFVTDEMLAKVEERVIAAIDRLADRLDRAFEARVRSRSPDRQ